MSEVLYPMGYGTRLVTFDVLRNTFEPFMHPEAARRGFNFILHQGGKFGIGGGYRPPGAQPDRPGFAPEGKSFHQRQKFPSCEAYAAWDMIVVNPGYPHRAPFWNEVPMQGTQLAFDYGWHMNVGKPGVLGAEPWHAQPIELDGWQTWMNTGQKDLQKDYPIKVFTPRQQPPQPPIPPTQPDTKGNIVQFTSRNLAEGATGSDVKFFQRQLNDIAGQGLLLDGYYGPKTTQAVKNWQSFFKKTSDGKVLIVDGKLGALTQQSIIEVSLLSA